MSADVIKVLYKMPCLFLGGGQFTLFEGMVEMKERKYMFWYVLPFFCLIHDFSEIFTIYIFIWIVHFIMKRR